MKWFSRFFLFIFGIPLLCGFCYAALFISASSVAADQFPTPIRRIIYAWILGKPQMIGDAGMFGAGSSVAGIGVGWDDYIDLTSFNLPFGMPIDSDGVWLGCDFHDPLYTNHSGVDLNVGSGFDDLGLPIISIMAGKVVYAGKNGDWGNLVVVENNGYQIWMAHLDEIYVANGQIVSYGELIGTLGNTGNSDGPHLHFGVKLKTEDGQIWLDPKDFLDPDKYWKQGCG